MRVLVSLSVLLAACGGTSKPAPPPAAAPAPAPAQAPDDVEILDPGAEPHVLLRYRVPVGTERRVELVLDMSTRVGTTTVVLPHIVWRGRQQVTASDAADKVDINSLFDEIEVTDRPGTDPAIRERLAALMETYKGTAFTMSMDDRGRFGDVRVDLSSSPGAEQMLDAMSTEYAVVLPRSPVGVGARWRIPFDAEKNGLHLTGEVMWTLVSLEGSVFTAQGAMTIDFPAQQAGPAIAGFGKGTVTLRSDLATYRGEMAMAMEIGAPAGDAGAHASMAMMIRYD